MRWETQDKGKGRCGLTATTMIPDNGEAFREWLADVIREANERGLAGQEITLLEVNRNVAHSRNEVAVHYKDVKAT